MSDAAFREALHRYDIAVNLQAAQPTYRNRKAAHEAREKVLALYAERQGEVYEVQAIRGEYDIVGIELDDDGYSPGDRVRVTKEAK